VEGRERVEESLVVLARGEWESRAHLEISDHAVQAELKVA
jgi:hypothetical protein